MNADMNTWATFAVRFSWGIDTVLDCDYKFTKKLKTKQHFYKGLDSHLFHFIVDSFIKCPIDYNLLQHFLKDWK
jgi:hypothetical protein